MSIKEFIAAERKPIYRITCCPLFGLCSFKTLPHVTYLKSETNRTEFLHIIKLIKRRFSQFCFANILLCYLPVESPNVLLDSKDNKLINK